MNTTKSFVMLSITPILSVVALLSCNSPEEQTRLEQAQGFFKPLPANFYVAGEEPSQHLIDLGQRLFFENSVSVDGKISCATCHHVAGYGADGLPKSIGNNGKLNPRNAPTVFNSAGHFKAHWRGDREDVEDQAIKALTGKPSFGAPNLAFVEKKLRESEVYIEEFALAFPGEKDPVTAKNYAIAVGAYERTLVTPSRFDEYLRGNTASLSDVEKKGLDLFINTGCAGCHSGPLVGGSSFQKFGLVKPYEQALYAGKTAPESIDHGRKDVTQKDIDLDVFKVPSLRNVEKTAPYFHDGSEPDLSRAIRVMAEAQLGKRLNDDETTHIAAFLKSITGKIPDNFKPRQ